VDNNNIGTHRTNGRKKGAWEKKWRFKWAN